MGGGGRTRNRITFTARSASQPHPHTFLRSARSGCHPFFIGRTCLQSLGSRTFSRAGGWENQEHCSTANVPAPKLCTQHRYTTSKHCWHQHNCTAMHVHVRDGCIANPSRNATPGTTLTGRAGKVRVGGRVARHLGGDAIFNVTSSSSCGPATKSSKSAVTSDFWSEVTGGHK